MTACRRPGRLALVLLALAVGAVGCGTDCETIRRSRTQFLERQDTTEEPHLVLALPLNLVNSLIKKNLHTIKAVSISLPGIGDIAPGLDQLSVKPHSLVVKGLHEGRLVFNVELKISLGRQELFGTQLEVEGSVNINTRIPALEIGLHADTLRAATPPTLSREAIAGIGAVIRKHLPDIPLSILTGANIDGIVHTALNQLLKTLYQKMPKQLLSGLSAVATVRVVMPSLPLRSVELRQTSTKAGDILDIALYTTLPVAAGLHPETTLPASFSATKARLRMSGSTGAQLANWAMLKGMVPSRYDDDGKPDSDGAWEAGLSWADDGRPLKLLAWKTRKDPCIMAVFGARPRLTVLKREVKVELEEGKLEKAQGPFALEAGIFLGLLSPTLSFSTKAASSMEFTLGGKTLQTRVTNAAIEQNELIFDLDIR